MKQLLFLILATVLIASCKQDDIKLRDQQRDQETLDSLLTEMQLLIADKSCSGEGQCKVMAYGDKACGGPVGFLVYSSANVDEQALTNLVSQYTILQSQMNDEYDIISDCSVPTAPNPACLSGKCE